MKKERNKGKCGIPQIMRRLGIGLAAVFMVLSAAACGRSSDPGDDVGQIWIPEFLSFEMEENSYHNLAFSGNTFYYISWQHQAENFLWRLSGYSLTEGPLPDKPLNWPDEKDRFVGSLLAMDAEGGFYLVAYVTEEDGSRAHLCKFDARGNQVYDTDISEEMNDPDLLAADGRGRVFISGKTDGKPCILLYDSEGVYSKTVLPDISNGAVTAMGRGKNDKMYACCHSNSGGGTNYFLAEIDFDRGKADVACPGFSGGDSSVLVPGMENSLLSFDRTAVYTCDLTSQIGEILLNWLDYGINGSRVTAVGAQEDGSLLAVITDLVDENCELVLLKKADGTQVPQKKTIVLGTVYSSSVLRNAVMEFNRESDQYLIKIREYLDPQTHDRTDAAIRMSGDILSDDCPDLLDLADLDLKALASRGLLVDLNPYLEGSRLLKPSDFLDNLLEAYTIDGKLITVPPRFSLKTVFGWSTETGGSSGWTLTELMAYADAHPDAELFDNTSRDEILQYLMSCSEDAFIDWSAGECCFESDVFKQLLEFVSRFPGEAEENSERSSTPVRIRNREVLLLVETLMEFDSIQLPLAIYNHQGSSIGFPSADGSAGCMLIPYEAYAITAKSDQKEGAWAFLEKLLTSGDSSSSFFPSLKTRLAEKAADAVTPEYLTDEEGKICLDGNGKPILKDAGMGIYYSDWEYTYHLPTQEEVDLTLRLIKEAKPVSPGGTSEVIKIINEEAESYYQGQKTVEEAAKVIQRRVRIYVKEGL